jgi:uncharacterized protein (DUF1499 family)
LKTYGIPFLSPLDVLDLLPDSLSVKAEAQYLTTEKNGKVVQFLFASEQILAERGVEVIRSTERSVFLQLY